MMAKRRGTGSWLARIGCAALAMSLSVVGAADIEMEGQLQVEKEESTTGATIPVLKLRAKSTGDMAQDFGPSILFQADDNADNYHSFASIHTGRVYADDDNSYLTFLTQESGSLTEQMRIRHDGRVGIGTQSPSTDFHVVGNGRFTGYVWAQGNLDVDGQVLVGSSASGDLWPLQVFEDNGDRGVALFRNVGDSPNAHGIQIKCGPYNGEDCTFLDAFDGNGDYIGGLISNGSGEFDFAGTSDRRLKEDIAPTRKECLNIIRNAPVRDFRYKQSKDAPGEECPVATGFIAQELAAVFPEAVIERPWIALRESLTTITLKAGETYKGQILTEPKRVLQTVTRQEVDGTRKLILPLRLIPILVGAVQQQEARIDDLAKNVDAVGSAVQAKGIAGATAYADMSFSELSDDVVQGIVDAVFLELGVDRWVEIPFAEAWEEVDELSAHEVVKTVAEHRINWETMAVENIEVEKTVVETKATGKRVRQLKAGVRFDAETGRFYHRVLAQESGLSSVDRTLLRRQVLEALRHASAGTEAISEARD